MPDRPLLSVITPCRNECRHIRPFLNSLLSQSLGGHDLEVLIADGRSNDGTGEILAEFARLDTRVRIIDNPRQIVSTGLNAAIRAARGEIIVRMDAHTEYAPDYVLRCVEALQATGAANVGGAPRARSGGLRWTALSAAYHSPFAVGGARSHDPDYEGYVDSVFYGCWLKQTLLDVGLFDETLVRNQDDELNLRLNRSGRRVWQSRSIVCWYTPRTRIGQLFRQYFQYGFWKVAVIRKHRLPACWRHLVPGAFVLAQVTLPMAAVGGWLGSSPPLVHAASAAWLSLILVYLAAGLAAAVQAARRTNWWTLPLLPPLFWIYHVSYGLGFLAGLVHALWPGQRGTSPPPWASRLTR